MPTCHEELEEVDGYEKAGVPPEQIDKPASEV